MKTCRRKWLARWLAACIAVVLGMGMCAGLPVSAAYENTYTNTGNQRADIVAVAKTQIGYHEGSLEGTTNSSNNIKDAFHNTVRFTSQVILYAQYNGLLFHHATSRNITCRQTK